VGAAAIALLVTNAAQYGGPLNALTLLGVMYLLIASLIRD
jgi:hypothetical protein